MMTQLLFSTTCIMLMLSLHLLRSFSFVRTCSVSRTKVSLAPLHAKLTVSRGQEFYQIDYFLHNSPQSKPPLVVLHGGPGLPCNYLTPLIEVILDRPILFYDQLGCGLSDQPEDKSLYSIRNSAGDLAKLLDEVQFEKYHLYGQSYGGILAFEYLKSEPALSRKCLSLVLSSAPSSIPLSSKERERMYQEIAQRVPLWSVDETFRRQHMCRTNKVPKALQKSFDRASKVWAGTDVIANYEASGKVLQSPPVLATRGEYDFVSLQNVQGWQTLFDVVEVRELQGCSHIGLLENPTLYGKILNEFLAKHDIL